VNGSFLTYKNGRWLWRTVVSAGALTLPYLHYRSETTAYGGSGIGLLYGVLGTAIIVVLMFLGLRKRSYASSKGTLQGWVSAHVYLGLLTLLIIPLHAGFRFGTDIHTLAFALLAIVVLSGIFGVTLYTALPSRLTKYESEGQADTIDREIRRLMSDMRFLVKDKSDGLVRIYQDEVNRLWSLKSKAWSLIVTRYETNLVAQRSADLARIASGVLPDEEGAFQALSQLILKKAQLEARLMKQMRLRNALQAWLYIHVPLSVAMTFAVVIHLWVVFYF
jgi:hypothetical protein